MNIRKTIMAALFGVSVISSAVSINGVIEMMKLKKEIKENEKKLHDIAIIGKIMGWGKSKNEEVDAAYHRLMSAIGNLDSVTNYFLKDRKHISFEEGETLRYSYLSVCRAFDNLLYLQSKSAYEVIGIEDKPGNIEKYRKEAKLDELDEIDDTLRANMKSIGIVPRDAKGDYDVTPIFKAEATMTNKEE